jgi:hypothetical protein
MAGVVVITRKEHTGSSRRHYGTFTFDSTYVNGTGEALTPAMLGMRVVDHLDMEPLEDGYLPKWDGAAVKLFFGDYNNAADGPFIEAANFDASGAVFKFEAVGRP